ncbi:MAG: adenine deaminase, partial [Treponema sp.]|nr:adenine deaminase [Treponema sp.]
TAAGRIPADLVISGGIIADVYSGSFIPADMAVTGGFVAACGEPGSYKGAETFDARGQYILPAFIDSHIHIESSFLSPPAFCRIALPRGTGTIIADPHEIVNVCGLEGLRYMLDSSSGLPMDIKFMVPSCVPFSSFENSGAVLNAPDLEAPLQNGRILGLGEMMDYPGVIAAKDGPLDKIVLALNKGKMVDGHSPGVSGKDLRAYAAAMIRTDHECSTPEEFNERLSRGMYVLLRHGSACRDLPRLLSCVTPENSRRCLLCTDDGQSETILKEGLIDNDLRICVEGGLDPMTAVRMATLNAAECYGLKDRGGFAPGMRADIAVVDGLKSFTVSRVYMMGKLCAENGRYLLPVKEFAAKGVAGGMRVKDFSAKKLELPLSRDEVYVIDLQKGSVVTGKGRAKVRRDAQGLFVFDGAAGIAKIAVVERHKNTGNVGVGLIRGYGIREGAVALSVGHDSHNITAAGANDADMVLAVRRIIDLGGGAVLVKNGVVIEELPLPIGGLMCGEPGEWVAAKLEAINKKAVEELGVSKEVEPLMTLCFMPLLVIPELKISDQGLFDVKEFKFIKSEIL